MTLETTVASVNSALQRARKAVDDRLPEQSQQATLRTLGDENDESDLQRAMEAYAEAKRREAEEAPWSPACTSSAGGPSASSPAGLSGGPAMSEPVLGRRSTIRRCGGSW